MAINHPKPPSPFPVDDHDTLLVNVQRLEVLEGDVIKLQTEIADLERKLDSVNLWVNRAMGGLAVISILLTLLLGVLALVKK